MVGSLVLIACGVVVLLALVSEYAIVSGVPGSANGSPEVTLPASSGTDREEIARTQTLINELKPLASSTASVLGLLEAALLARPSGVVVENIHLTRGDPATLILAGSASSRDDINMYRTVLTKDPRFRSVSVPIGILAGTEGGRFTVTLTGDF